MTPTVPTTILLERERANSFRRHMEILHERCTESVGFSDLRMSQRFIEELAWYKAAGFHFDSPLVTVEWAVGWAISVPPPISLLRAARALWQAAADDWAFSFQFAHEIHAKAISLHKCEWPDWLATCTRIAVREQKRIEVILREDWPGGTREDEERALAQLHSGTALGLDEAFTQIAGVSKEEWDRRVQEHRKIGKTQEQ